MSSMLGISAFLGPLDINFDAIRNSKIFYIEGYMVTSDENFNAVTSVLDNIRDTKITKALSLSDAGIVMGFRDKFENPMSLLRCNYYPPRKSTLSNKDYGIAPHTDYGCLTILLTDNNPGLEIKNPSDEWESVLPKEEEIIINFGDMLEFWSNKKIKATSHRVFGNSDERFSIPFFFIVSSSFRTLISSKTLLSELTE